MELNSIILYHIRKIKDLDYRSARNYLNKRFSVIGSGQESVVFSRKGFDYVIKLQHNPFNNSGTKVDIPDSVHFIPTKVIECRSFNIIIQKKVDHTVCGKYYTYQKRFEKFRLFMEKKFSVSDIHDENVGIVNGRMVVFDWCYRG
jgi:hypothetical protein